MKLSKLNIFLIHIFLSYFFVVCSLIIIGSGLDRANSYLAILLFVSISIIYLCIQFFRLFNINILLISLFGFLLKLFIGYLFFRFYMWEDYFSNSRSEILFDHWEYLYFWESVIDIARYRIENGYIAIIPDTLEAFNNYQGKYFFINYIMSNLFLSGNENLLDFSVQNTLFSFYSAIILSMLGLKYECTKKHAKLIFIITFFQPFSLISVIIWRDVVGQFFVFFSVYLMLNINTSKLINSLLILTFSSISIAIFRPIYIVIPTLLYCIRFFKIKFINTRAKINFFLINLFIVCLVLFLTQNPNFISEIKRSYISYLELDVLKFIMLLPLNIIRNIIGPFPWVIWFDFDDTTIFLIGNYLQAVYVTVIFYFTTLYYKVSSIKIKFDLIFIISIILLMALSVEGINNAYFSFCVSLLLPIFIKHVSLKKFCTTYFMFFGGFILLNILYVSLGFYGSNLGKLLKF